MCKSFRQESLHKRKGDYGSDPTRKRSHDGVRVSIPGCVEGLSADNASVRVLCAVAEDPDGLSAEGSGGIRRTGDALAEEAVSLWGMWKRPGVQMENAPREGDEDSDDLPVGGSATALGRMPAVRSQALHHPDTSGT